MEGVVQVAHTRCTHTHTHTHTRARARARVYLDLRARLPRIGTHVDVQLERFRVYTVVFAVRGNIYLKWFTS